MPGPLGLREEGWGGVGVGGETLGQEEEDLASWSPGLREEAPRGSDPSPNTPSLKYLMACPAPPPPVNLDPRNHDPVVQTLGMEKIPDRDALSGRMEAEGSQNSEELPPHPQSPPPPPSPRSPTSPETPELPQPNAPTEFEARQLLVEEWGPVSGKLELPPSISWKLLFLERPLYRNLLNSPNPEGGGCSLETPWRAAQKLGLFIFLCSSCFFLSAGISVPSVIAHLSLFYSASCPCVSVCLCFSPSLAPFSRFLPELQRLTITAHQHP